jgi:hypothetical protein
MKQIKSPPPALPKLDDLLADFRPSGSRKQEMRRPAGKVKVVKKGAAFGGLKKLLGGKAKIYEPNCAKRVNLCFGETAKALSINCGGCAFSSDLSDPECRLRCSQLAGAESFESLILDDGNCKKEYRQADVGKLRETASIADSLAVSFPQECNECAKEHYEQVEKLKTAMLRDPAKLLSSGVEVTESEDTVVKGVASEVCEECQKRTEEAVGKAFLRLGGMEMKGFSPMVRPFFSNSRVLFELPEKSSIEEVYDHCGSKVILSRGQEETYSVFPPEYKLDKGQLKVMKAAHSALLKSASSLDDKQFSQACRSEILRAGAKEGCELSEEDCRLMTDNLVRCTLGLDIVELLLKDQNLQDVYINSPIDSTPL